MIQQSFAASPDLSPLIVTDAERRESIRVVSRFTAEPLEDPLRFWMRFLERDLSLSFAGFNQVFQELLHPTSEALAQKGINLFLIRSGDLREATSTGAHLSSVEIDRLTNALASFKGASSARASI